MADEVPKKGKLPRVIVAGTGASLVLVLIAAFAFNDFSASQLELVSLVIGGIVTIAGALVSPAQPGGADPMLGDPQEPYAAPGDEYAPQYGNAPGQVPPSRPGSGQITGEEDYGS